MATKSEILKALKEEMEAWKDAEPTFVEVPAEFLKDIRRLLEEKKRG